MIKYYYNFILGGFSMKQCTNCQAFNADKSDHCSECGAKLPSYAVKESARESRGVEVKQYLITTIILILCAIVIFIVVSKCRSTKPEYMSDAFYNAGVSFIQTCDDIIDLKVDLESGYDKLNYYQSVLDSLANEMPNGSTEEALDKTKCENISTQASIIILKVAEANSHYKAFSSFPDGFYSEFTENRNKIAKELYLETK